jgi:sigma-B regulation protein RsbU (phosphoserine phosphatase)
MPDSDFPGAEFAMQKDDIIVAYTDGVVEAEDGNGELFGVGRLCDVIDQDRDSTAEDIRNSIVSALDSYTDGRPISDDTTIVALKKL